MADPAAPAPSSPEDVAEQQQAQLAQLMSDVLDGKRGVIVTKAFDKRAPSGTETFVGWVVRLEPPQGA